MRIIIFSSDKRNGVESKSEHQPALACCLNFRSALINREHTKKGDRSLRKTQRAYIWIPGQLIIDVPSSGEEKQQLATHKSKPQDEIKTQISL